MSRRAFRNLVILSAVLLLLGSVEVGLNLARGPEGCVEIVNQGREPIEDLVLTSGSSRETSSRLAPGESARFYITTRGFATLDVTFRQRGNVLGRYSVPGFNAEYLRRDSLKLVLVIRPGEVERYQDEVLPRGPIALIWHKAWKGFAGSFEPGIDDE